MLVHFLVWTFRGEPLSILVCVAISSIQLQ